MRVWEGTRGMTIKRLVAGATIWAGLALLLISLARADATAEDKDKADVVLHAIGDNAVRARRTAIGTIATRSPICNSSIRPISAASRSSE